MSLINFLTESLRLYLFSFMALVEFCSREKGTFFSKPVRDGWKKGRYFNRQLWDSFNRRLLISLNWFLFFCFLNLKFLFLVRLIMDLRFRILVRLESWINNNLALIIFCSKIIAALSIPHI
jgi:hypothetical protein